jgi:hypothetical protein
MLYLHSSRPQVILADIIHHNGVHYEPLSHGLPVFTDREKTPPTTEGVQSAESGGLIVSIRELRYVIALRVTFPTPPHVNQHARNRIYKANLQSRLQQTSPPLQHLIYPFRFQEPTLPTANMQFTTITALLATVAMTTAAPSADLEARQGLPRVRATFYRDTQCGRDGSPYADDYVFLQNSVTGLAGCQDLPAAPTFESSNSVFFNETSVTRTSESLPKAGAKTVANNRR